MNNVEKLNQILLSFKIAAVCTNFSEYKNACFYDIELKPGSRVRDIEKYITELSLALKTPSKPRVKILPEKGIIRFEFLKSQSSKLNLFNFGYDMSRPPGKIMCLIGETLEGAPLWFDIVKNPHMLVAGCTGSGKSTLLHNIIANLLVYNNIKIHLMDPKNIEFYKYVDVIDKIKVSFDYTECLSTLENLCTEMDRRYSIMRSQKISSEKFPYIVLIIDEFADLIMQDINNRFHKSLCRLAQKSRAAGIHIIISTQRPSATIIDGSIKANFPSRISCKVASHVDSKVILDTTGAEQLVGQGDSIIKNNEYNLQRFQVAHTTPEEICFYFGNKNANSQIS